MWPMCLHQFQSATRCCLKSARLEALQMGLAEVDISSCLEENEKNLIRLYTVHLFSGGSCMLCGPSSQHYMFYKT